MLADLAGAKDDALGHQLLEDIRTIFDEVCRRRRALPAPPSEAREQHHRRRPEGDGRSPLVVSWAKQARPITQNMLARMLKDFEITTHGPIRLI